MSTTFTLDSQRSRFTVQAFATGLLAGFAHSPVFAVRDYQGEIEMADGQPAAMKISLTIRASSLELIDSVKESDRREIQRQLMEEVLETAQYPQIAFTSTKVATTQIAANWFRSQIEGDMKLHGITRSVPIDAQLRINEPDVRLSGELTLLLSAFKIKRVSAMGGMIKLKDELKFAFDFVGQQKPELN
jgi:polyisoprenoid-binding protein YceI